MSRAAPLRCQLRPSWILAGLILGAHGAAAACAALVLPGTAGSLLAALLLALGAASAWSRALLRWPSSIRVIDVLSDGLMLESAAGKRIPAQPAGRRYVNRWLVTLPVRKPSRLTILVTSDMLAPATFRRLRLWALWGRLAPVAGAQLTA